MQIHCKNNQESPTDMVSLKKIERNSPPNQKKTKKVGFWMKDRLSA
jgi:hypothetical protein